MAEFTPAYEITLSNEGAYSKDSRDRGGETYKGISRNMNPKWEGWDVIDAIKANVPSWQFYKSLDTDEELQLMVHDFYELIFWQPLQLAEITDQEIANELFDTAVNQGSVRTIKHFQQALNLLNDNGKHYSDINEDGKMGPDSMKAYNAFMLTAAFAGRSKDRNIKTLLKALNGLQFCEYVAICNENPLQEVYFYGWMNRI